MTEKGKDSREEQIFKAAEKVFINKGYHGTTMHDIALEAGTNKALLHYYFRSKEKLFLEVLRDAFMKFVPRAGEILQSDLTFFEKIAGFINIYLTLLIENPHIPSFVMHEISSNPERLTSILEETGIQPQYFMALIEEEVLKGTIRPVNPHHLIVNILALCIFPFAARPILQRTALVNYDKEYAEFLLERENEIMEFITQSLIVK